MCGWTQVHDDQYNWLPNKGPTQTRLTGPMRDHTLGSKGNNVENYKFLVTQSLKCFFE